MTAKVAKLKMKKMSSNKIKKNDKFDNVMKALLSVPPKKKIKSKKKPAKK